MSETNSSNNDQQPKTPEKKGRVRKLVGSELARVALLATVAYFTLAPDSAPGVSKFEESVNAGVEKAGQVVGALDSATDGGVRIAFEALPNSAQDKIIQGHQWVGERITDVTGGPDSVSIEDVGILVNEVNGQNGGAHLGADSIRNQLGHP